MSLLLIKYRKNEEVPLKNEKMSIFIGTITKKNPNFQATIISQNYFKSTANIYSIKESGTNHAPAVWAGRTSR